ncbi:MAG: TonB-dependent receptor [Cellvibrionaceae bacterium]|nr:TonB-dependent receptor [Cellvibrionaceae bacterium]
MFNKNKLSAAIVALVAGSSNYALAQENPIVEEVIVTGIRASAQASMDVKRDATGVVDAITSEDMGKFPDTNLAESLQRITGVSISRSNGEGSEVTVRGFGGEFNMITLNGRTMPTANVYGGGSGAGGTRGGSTRAFDFANIASENVSAVEVYKTGRASVATGGIGASINVNTARPLDNPGLQFSVGAKALNDTTNRTGDDVTPEVSGIVSWTDDNEMFGVGLSLSRQERHSGSTGVSENEWQIARWGEGNNLFSFAPGLQQRAGIPDLNAMRTGTNVEFADELKGIYNAPAPGQLYGRPNDIRYVFSDLERTRTNAQVVFQFAPNENLKTTLDYTFAQNELFERRGESTSWLANENSIDAVVFSNDEVATPIFIHETAGPRDQGFEQQLRQQENTLESVGFNLEWQASDTFSLAFDLHDSTMESLPVGPGKSGEIAASIGAPIQTSHWIDFSGDLPLYNMNFDDGIQATTTLRDPRTPDFAPRNYQVNGADIRFPVWAQTWNPALDGSGNPVVVNGVPQQTFGAGVTPTAVYRGNNNDQFDAGDIGSQVVRVFYAAQTTDVQQAKLDGSFEFDNGQFDFGVERRTLEMSAQASDRYMAFGDWGIANVGDIPSDLFEFYNLSDFDDYNASQSFQFGFKGNAEDIAQSLIDNPLYAGRGNVLAYNPNLSLNDNIKEEITALYVQAKMEGSLGGLDTTTLVGLRYETTDVTSVSDMLVPTYLQWQDNNDFQVMRASTITTILCESKLRQSAAKYRLRRQIF